MNIIESNLVTMFDVDDTLIYWDKEDVELREVVQIKLGDNKPVLKRAIIENVNELKRQKESGSFIIVWSASGHEWAKAVVKALGIEDYVDLAMSKPIRVYDDKEPQEWMPKRRHLLK